MASPAASGTDDSGRRRPRLAASLKIRPGHSPWRPSASLGQDPLDPATAHSAVGSEGGEHLWASAAAGDIGPRVGTRVWGLGAAQAREDLGERRGRSPSVSLAPAGPSGDFPKAAQRLGLQLKDPKPGQAVALLTKYAASLSISLSFRENWTAGKEVWGLGC